MAIERLFIKPKKGGSCTIEITRKTNGTAQNYWDNRFAIIAHTIKDAWIQRYPKKDNPPEYLVKDGILQQKNIE